MPGGGGDPPYGRALPEAPLRGYKWVPFPGGPGALRPEDETMKALPILGIASIALLAVPLARAFTLG